MDEETEAQGRLGVCSRPASAPPKVSQRKGRGSPGAARGSTPESGKARLRLAHSKLDVWCGKHNINSLIPKFLVHKLACPLSRRCREARELGCLMPGASTLRMVGSILGRHSLPSSSCHKPVTQPTPCQIPTDVPACHPECAAFLGTAALEAGAKLRVHTPALA